MVGNRKGSGMGMICQQWRRRGGGPSLSLMHPLHFLHAQNPLQQVSFQTIAIKAILTLKLTPEPPPPPPPRPQPPQFFSVLSIFWPAKKENKGEGIETLHYRLTGLMFLRSITCNSPCFWWPQASVLMFLITNYYLSPAMMSTEDKNWFILYPFNGIHAFNLLLTETRDKLHKYYSNSPLGASFWSRWILYPLSALIRKLYDWK